MKHNKYAKQIVKTCLYLIIFINMLLIFTFCGGFNKRNSTKPQPAPAPTLPPETVTALPPKLPIRITSDQCIPEEIETKIEVLRKQGKENDIMEEMKKYFNIYWIYFDCGNDSLIRTRQLSCSNNLQYLHKSNLEMENTSCLYLKSLDVELNSTVSCELTAKNFKSIEASAEIFSKTTDKFKCTDKIHIYLLSYGCDVGSDSATKRINENRLKSVTQALIDRYNKIPSRKCEDISKHITSFNLGQANISLQKNITKADLLRVETETRPSYRRVIILIPKENCINEVNSE